MLCKILVHYPNSDNWNEGDVVEISNPVQLIKEGKVEAYVESVQEEETTKPVVEEVVIAPKKKWFKKKK